MPCNFIYVTQYKTPKGSSSPPPQTLQCLLGVLWNSKLNINKTPYLLIPQSFVFPENSLELLFALL